MGWKWTLLSGLTITLSLLQSCYKEKFEPIKNNIIITPTLAIPLANGDLNIDGSLVLYGIPEINLDEIVPFWAQYDTIFFIDTLALSLSDIENRVDEIRFIEMNFMTWNDFPVGAQVQVIFINNEGSVLHSLFAPSPLSLSSGEVNDQGEVLKSGYSFTTSSINEEDITDITSADRVVLFCSVSNIGVPINQFNHYENYIIKLKLSARVGLNINL